MTVKELLESMDIGGDFQYHEQMEQALEEFVHVLGNPYIMLKLLANEFVTSANNWLEEEEEPTEGSYGYDCVQLRNAGQALEALAEKHKAINEYEGYYEGGF